MGCLKSICEGKSFIFIFLLWKGRSKHMTQTCLLLPFHICLCKGNSTLKSLELLITSVSRARTQAKPSLSFSKRMNCNNPGTESFCVIPRPNSISLTKILQESLRPRGFGRKWDHKPAGTLIGLLFEGVAKCFIGSQ